MYGISVVHREVILWESDTTLAKLVWSGFLGHSRFDIAKQSWGRLLRAFFAIQFHDYDGSNIVIVKPYLFIYIYFLFIVWNIITCEQHWTFSIFPTVVRIFWQHIWLLFIALYRLISQWQCSVCDSKSIRLVQLLISMLARWWWFGALHSLSCVLNTIHCNWSNSNCIVICGMPPQPLLLTVVFTYQQLATVVLCS